MNNKPSAYLCLAVGYWGAVITLIIILWTR